VLPRLRGETSEPKDGIKLRSGFLSMIRDPRHSVRCIHLTHGAVASDARVARAIDAIAREFGRELVVAVGVWQDGELVAARPGSANSIAEIRMWSHAMRRATPRLAALLFLVELNLRMAWRALRYRAVVVHCHDHLVLPAGWLAGSLLGARLVYDAHELESDRVGTPNARRLAWVIERWCWSRVDLLISVSPSIIDWYQQHFGPKQSALVLNSPASGSAQYLRLDFPPRVRETPGYFHACFEIPAEAKVFIYLGLLVPGRGIERLLEVFSGPDTRSHIVFMGYGDKLGVGDAAQRCPNIHLHPAVSHEQVVEYVRHADCGVCLIEDVSLSDRLCLPNKLFEYAFAGIPVLASRLPEIERVVREFGLGVCCDNDVESIRQAVKAIERDGISPPTADLSELSSERQAERLRDAYRQLLGGQSRSLRNQPKMAER
jgi:glycosyltransferase involved in cell wall biosynthesis